MRNDRRGRRGMRKTNVAKLNQGLVGSFRHFFGERDQRQDLQDEQDYGNHIKSVLISDLVNHVNPV
jgi:hypothetical protein